MYVYRQSEISLCLFIIKDYLLLCFYNYYLVRSSSMIGQNEFKMNFSKLVELKKNNNWYILVLL